MANDVFRIRIIPTISIGYIPPVLLEAGESVNLYDYVVDPNTDVVTSETLNASPYATYSHATGELTGVSNAVIDNMQLQASTVVSVLMADYPIAAYGQSAIVFTVRIPTVSGSDTNFTYTTQDSGTGDDYAAAGTDYTATSGSGTITAGDLYTQISVPIAGNTPPNGRHEFEMSLNGGQVVSTGLIMDAIHINDFDYPSIGASQKQNWERDNQAGSWRNSNMTVTNATYASIQSDIPAAVGVNCLWHDMETSAGVQGTYGLDSLSTLLAGDIFDGEEYYYRWWMKIVDGFIWVGDGQDKMKSGRLVAYNVAPNYTTTYIQGHQFYWSRSYPDSGNSTLDMTFDFAGQDDEWHEYIIYQKRETAYEAGDAICRLVVDGVLEFELLNTDWAEVGKTEPGGGTEVRISNMGLVTWFQNQIGAQGGTDHTGGQIYTDGHICTKGHWPSAKYARPW